MKSPIATLFAVTALTVLSACSSEPQPPAAPAAAPEPAPAASATPSYRIAWSHYTGWEPWGYAQHAGILKRWADKHGVAIELSLVNDYVESINLYTSGSFDGVVMTNMDALTIPAVGGVDSQAIIVGDTSNGNDGIVAKNASSVKDLKGRTINLVELSVSHYVLARALDINGMSEQDVKLVNTSDADIAALFAADPNGAAVTWNPPLMQARAAPGATLLFDSSQLPGEVIDLMVVRTDAPDALKHALADAWYETMAVINGGGPDADAAIAFMAEASGATVDEFRQQLQTTAMYYTPAEGAAFARDATLRDTMEKVRTFSHEKGLYGEGKPLDFVGIEFDDGAVLGDAGNIKLRFTSKYMAAAGE